MAQYWKFNEDACTFDQCDRQTALGAEVPVIVNEDGELRVVIDGKSTHWPGGEPLDVAGVPFDSEEFEG
jgi:hypothetical protein